MADDLAVRLGAILDRAEADNAHADFRDRALVWGPGTVRRLIERDRALLNGLARLRTHLESEDGTMARVSFAGMILALEGEVERAAAFWGVLDGT